jgi:hypothetical protein
MGCNGFGRRVVCQAGPADLVALGQRDRQAPNVNGNVEQWVPWCWMYRRYLAVGAMTSPLVLSRIAMISPCSLAGTL